MSKQTWTALVSAVLFVALAATLAFAPTPYVIWSPGQAIDLLADGDKPPVTVTGATTYPTTGRLLLTTVNVTRADSQVSLLAALHAYWSPDREPLPAAAVYPAGATASEVEATEADQMADSQDQARAAALSAAGLPVQRVPVVASVSSSGAAGDLREHDIIVAVDGAPVTNASEVESAVAARQIGEPVLFTVIRDGIKLGTPIRVTTVAHKVEANIPVAGAKFVNGFTFGADVGFNLDPQIGGQSAGLTFGLAVYDRVTPGALMGDRVVAASGTLDSEGKVGPVGGMREKVLSAEAAGASVLLMPTENCADLAGVPHGVRLVPVTTLTEAVTVLGALADPATSATVKECS